MRKNLLGLVVLSLGGAALAMGCTPDVGLASGRNRDAGPSLPRDSGFVFNEDAGLGFRRSFGDPVSASTAPPAISGGTLLAAPTGTLAFASDPEDDRVVVVDTATAAKLGEVRLQAGDEPGRLVLDAAGRLHVALRRGGAIVTVDVSTPSAPAITARRSVCAAPRGIAYDAATDSLYVVCNGGELVTLPSVGEITRTTMLPDDLRDVVVIDATWLFVTRFRSAQVLVVDRASGTVTSSTAPPDTLNDAMLTMSAAVAWRAIPSPDGRGALVLHQRASTTPIDLAQPSAYGGSGRRECGTSVVLGAISPVALGASIPPAPSLGCTPLPVDLAVSPDGASLVVAAAGAMPLDPEQYRVFSTDALVSSGAITMISSEANAPIPGRITAVAYDAAGTILVQTRAPATITRVTHDGIGTPLASSIMLGGADHADTGLEVFHSNAGAGLACASCHPENGDDGHVWNFVGIGGRRTIPVRGGVSATAPYHWDGEFADMPSLLDDVFARRMGGGHLDGDYQAAMLHWLDAQPQLPARAVPDLAAVTRGQDLFDSPDVGCTDCHTGALASDEMTVDVGTGGAFQVPSLHGLVDRAPYLHDGRAATLEDRFGPMGGGDHHGTTSILTPAQIGDLVAYLRTL